jgi:hypothetical protein
MIAKLARRLLVCVNKDASSVALQRVADNVHRTEQFCGTLHAAQNK